MRWISSHKLLLTGLLVFVAILVVALWPEAVVVDLARVERGPLRVTLDAEGETRVRERFVVSAPVSGRLRRVQLQPGDPVTNDSTVAELTSIASPLLDPRTQSELTAAVAAAQAALGVARAERERLAAELERIQSRLRQNEELARAGAVSADELEATRTAARTTEEALRAAEFGVERAASELELARARVGRPGSTRNVLAVRAPADGVVLRRFHESEAVVQAGEPLLEIGDPAMTEIVADLLSTDAVRVTPGARVSIEDWGGASALEGRVRRVEPSGFTKVSALGVEEQRVNIIIDWAAPTGDVRKLGDGYRVEVRIVEWETPDALQVPVGSLFRHGSGWAVFGVEDGKARLHEVELGRRNEHAGEILRGLTEGRDVVMHPPDSVHDGVRLQVRGVDDR